MLPICSTLLPISRASLWSRMAHFREIVCPVPEHGFEGEERGSIPNSGNAICNGCFAEPLSTEHRSRSERKKAQPVGWALLRLRGALHPNAGKCGRPIPGQARALFGALVLVTGFGGTGAGAFVVIGALLALLLVLLIFSRALLGLVLRGGRLLVVFVVHWENPRFGVQIVNHCGPRAVPNSQLFLFCPAPIAIQRFSENERLV